MKTILKLFVGICFLLGIWQMEAAGQAVPNLGKGMIKQVAYSPDGKLLAAADDSVRVWLYDTQALAAVGVLQGHTRGVNAVAFSPDGTLLASGGDAVDNTVRLWDVGKRAEIAALKGHTRGVSSLAFSPDGKLLAAGGGSDRIVHLWDVVQRKEVVALKGHTGAVASVAFSLGGKLVASGSDDKTIRLWDVAQQKEIAALSGHTGAVTSVAFSPDGQLVASGSGDNTVRLWDVNKRTEAALLEGHTSAVRAVAFSPDGTVLASGALGGPVRVWDVVRRQQIAVLSGNAVVQTVAFSPDGRILASGGGSVRFWDVAQSRQVGLLLHRKAVSYKVGGTIHSPALEGNLIGDPATRPYVIYLPPSYDVSDKRYPVIYVLSGYGMDAQALTKPVRDTGDRMLQRGEIKEMIAVFVDELSRFGGGQYRSSITIGDYETYIVRDLVAHVETNYRTIPHRNSRGITGYSDGGAGAWHLALKFPEIFSAVVMQAAGGSWESAGTKEWLLAAASLKLQDWGEWASFDFSTRVMLSVLAAWAPNPKKPPFFLDKGAELVNGEAQLVPEVWQKIVAQDDIRKVEEYVQQTVRLNGIKIVIGRGDSFNPVDDVRALDRKLTDVGIEHVYLEHSGGHEFLPEESLSFLSERLTFEIPAGILPQASFKIALPDKTSPLQVQPRDVVHLTDVSNGTITNRLWDFGDGQTSAESNPTHIYAAPRQYTVTLTVTGPGGSSTATRTVVVTAPKVVIVKLTTRLARATSGVALDGKRLLMRAGLAVSLAADGVDATGNAVAVTPSWAVIGDIGTITADGTFTAGKKAGNRGSIVATAEGLSDTLTVTLLPGALTQITVTPTLAALKYSQMTVFRATGADAFNNRVTIRPLWHTVGGIGTVDKKSGVFRAGTKAGTGYVIAYADSIFGDTGAKLSGSAKVVVEDQAVPNAYALSQNRPNPFNPESTLTYDLPEVADVRLIICDLAGRAVRTLVHAYQQQGRYDVVWDGRDAEGQEVASGIYFYRLEAVDRGFVETKRMILIR